MPLVKPTTGSLNWDTTLNAALDYLDAAYQAADAAHLGAADPHGDRAYARDYVAGLMGDPSGLATLGSDGKVPASQLPDGAAHTHSDYASSGHDHSGVYSLATHDHDSAYSAAGHGHAASAITVTPVGLLVATDVQSALEELDDDLRYHGHDSMVMENLTIMAPDDSAVPMVVMAHSSETGSILQVVNGASTDKLVVTDTYTYVEELRLKDFGKISIRNGDANHYIAYDSGTDGPGLRGWGGVGLYAVNNSTAWHRFLGVHRDGVIVYGSRPAEIPLRVRGASGQSTDILQIQNSAGTSLARFEYDGTMHAPWVQVGGTGDFTGALNVRSASTGGVGLSVQARAGQTGDLSRWRGDGGTKTMAINSAARPKFNAFDSTAAVGAYAGYVDVMIGTTNYKLPIYS